MCVVVVVERWVDGKLGAGVVRDERAWRCGGGGWVRGIGVAWERMACRKGTLVLGALGTVGEVW